MSYFRLNTINESTHSILSDSDYDKTEDDLQSTYLRSGRKYKRPSAPPMEEAEPKRRRSDEEVIAIHFNSTFYIYVGSTLFSFCFCLDLTQLQSPNLGMLFSMVTEPTICLIIRSV